MNPIVSKSLQFCSQSLSLALVSTALLLPLASHAATGAAPAASVASSAIPVADFFRQSEFSGASLSPDGKHLVMLTADQNDRLTLSLLDLATMKAKLLARYADADVGQVNWVNNNRLVYSIGDRKLAIGERYIGSGLYAVDIQTGHQRQLISRRGAPSNSRILSAYHGFFSTTNEKDSNDIYVTEFLPSSGTRPNSSNLLRLNTVTGQAKHIDRPGDVLQWVIDHQGLPRVVTTFNKGNTITWLKDDQGGKWNKLYETVLDDKDAISPEFFGPDGSFYVSARQGKDTTSLYRYDLVKNRIDAEPVFSLDGYDYNGDVFFDKVNKKILGFRYNTDAFGTLWLDDGYKAIQKKVDEAFPDKSNLISIRTESPSDTVLVYSMADNDPGTYRMYNHKTGTFTLLGQPRPWIKPAQMAHQDFFKFKARDGLEIPSYLTLPKGQKKNLPLVVMVHGGPFVRGEYWGWNPETQFLASRGYAVLQMEYRGSTGYGYKHESLGYKQWGLKMQDDITDGTKWAIAQGIADPKRICIAGASYGGYATVIGLIKEPDLYQCGISWVGVTDISMLYTLTQSDFDDNTATYYLPQKVADLKKDAAQIKATSAVENASKLKAPLILAYGGTDARVPQEHGERLKTAMNGANPNLEWIVYPEEGHGWSKLKNNVDFWTRVETFLNRFTWKQGAGKAEATPVNSGK